MGRSFSIYIHDGEYDRLLLGGDLVVINLNSHLISYKDPLANCFFKILGSHLRKFIEIVDGVSARRGWTRFLSWGHGVWDKMLHYVFPEGD